MFSRPTVGRTENPFESDPYAEPSSPPEYKDDDFVSSPAEALPPRPDEFAEEDVGGSFASQQPAQPTQPPGPNERANNWPVCKPFLYHSIKDDIEASHRALVRQLYGAWWLTIASLTMNLVGTLCILIAGINGQDFGIAVMYFFVITVLSFFLWYRPVYTAFRRDSSFYFWLYFFFGGWHVLFCLYMWLGFETTGGAGIINAVLLFNNDKQAEGIVCIVSMLFWFATAVMNAILFYKVYRHYRSKGHSFQEARNQATTAAVQSDVVRSAGAAAGTAAFNSYTRQTDEV